MLGRLDIDYEDRIAFGRVPGSFEHSEYYFAYLYLVAIFYREVRKGRACSVTEDYLGPCASGELSMSTGVGRLQWQP